MKSGLQLGNGPVFSLGFGAYNTQTTAFGFSTTTNTWAFSNNGNNMNVSGKSGSVSDIYSGMLTVNFLAENGSTYVEAFLGDTALVNKTEINYEKSVLYLNGLTLGGWAQHIRQRLFHDRFPFHQPDSGTGDILSGVPGTGRPSGKAPQTLMSDCFYLPRQHLERWQTHLLLSSNPGLLKALLLPSVETFPRSRIFFRIFNIIYTVRGL